MIRRSKQILEYLGAAASGSGGVGGGTRGAAPAEESTAPCCHCGWRRAGAGRPVQARRCLQMPGRRGLARGRRPAIKTNGFSCFSLVEYLGRDIGLSWPRYSTARDAASHAGRQPAIRRGPPPLAASAASPSFWVSEASASSSSSGRCWQIDGNDSLVPVVRYPSPNRPGAAGVGRARGPQRCTGAVPPPARIPLRVRAQPLRPGRSGPTWRARDRNFARAVGRDSGPSRLSPVRTNGFSLASSSRTMIRPSQG